MKRLEGGYIGARPAWSISNQLGVWTPEQQLARARSSLWPSVDPIPLLSPILRYDFNDATTVSVSGSVITQVTSKGSRNWTFTGPGSSGPTRGTWINGKQCCDFGNSNHSNYLRTTDTTSTSIADIYIVLDASFGSTFSGNRYLFEDALSGTFIQLVAGSGSSWFINNGYFNAAYLNGRTTNAYETNLGSSSILPTINSPSIMRVNRINSTALTTTGGFVLGNSRGFNLSWLGQIGEFVAFSSVLNSTNASNVVNYLASKWSVTLG